MWSPNFWALPKDTGCTAAPGPNTAPISVGFWASRSLARSPDRPGLHRASLCVRCCSIAYGFFPTRPRHHHRWDRPSGFHRRRGDRGWAARASWSRLRACPGRLLVVRTESVSAAGECRLDMTANSNESQLLTPIHLIPPRWALVAGRASRMAASALRPARRPIATMEQRSA